MTKLGKLAKPYRIEHGKHFRLKDFDPADTGKMESGKDTDELLLQIRAKLAELQDMLYAQDRWGLLLIFQAMDAAGKDGAIKHVMSGVNPQGCEVHSFKAPSPEELAHGYLWRASQRLPQRGRIGIFNRSHYEELLIVRVHPEILKNEKLPPELVTKNIWDERFKDICAWERYLGRNGLVIRKFFLNVSKKEQKKRFLARLQEPEKNWKFSPSDVHERQSWDDYMKAYEDMIRNTSTPEAPWYVIPADNKWFTRLAIASAIVDTLEGLDLAYPQVDAAKRKELDAAKVLLEKKE